MRKTLALSLFLASLTLPAVSAAQSHYQSVG